jgi:hypothetical protein
MASMHLGRVKHTGTRHAHALRSPQPHASPQKPTWKVSGTPVGGSGTLAACGATVTQVDRTSPALAHSNSSSLLPRSL